jgi:hypothetical protein
MGTRLRSAYPAPGGGCCGSRAEALTTRTEVNLPLRPTPVLLFLQKNYRLAGFCVSSDAGRAHRKVVGVHGLTHSVRKLPNHLRIRHDHNIVRRRSDSRLVLINQHIYSQCRPAMVGGPIVCGSTDCSRLREMPQARSAFGPPQLCPTRCTSRAYLSSSSSAFASLRSGVAKPSVNQP